MSTTEVISRGNRREEIIRNWWRELQDDPAARSALRRCDSVDAVQLLPVFHRLRLSLKSSDAGGNRDALAAVASVLAQVEDDVSLPGERANFADLLAEQPTAGGVPKVSGLRFRRLLEVDTPDERLISIGRIVRHCQRKAPVASLATDLLFWGDRVRKRWAYRYYELAPNAD